MADGRVEIDVILDDKQVGKGVKSVDKKLGGIISTSKRAAASIGKIVTALGLFTVGARAVDTLTRSLDGAISRYDTLNTFPKVMQQIGFSAEESQKAIDKLSDGIQGLPTKLDDVTKTAQQIATMTGDLDGAVDTTLALNNAFLASGASSEDSARGLQQYVQMLSRGEADLESWRTLQETMGVALNDVAKAFGFAGASAQNDLYDALKEGDVTFDQFNNKLIELSNTTNGFADRALTASGGIRTAWTNMGTAVQRGLANVITSIDKVLAGTSFKSIENILNNSGKRFESMLNTIANGIPKAAKFIQRLYDNVEPLFPLFRDLGAVVASVTVGLLAFKATLAITTLVNSLSGALLGLRTALFYVQYGFVALQTAIMANPIGFIVGVIAGLATMFIYLWNTSDTFRNSIIAIGNALSGLFVASIEMTKSAIDRLSDSFSVFGAYLTTKTIDLYNQSMQKLSDAIQAVQPFVDGVKKSFSGFANLISDGIDKVANAGITLGDVFRTLSGPITSVVIALVGLTGPVGLLISSLTFLATKTNIVSDMIKVFKGEMEFDQAINNMADMATEYINNLSTMITNSIEKGTEIIVGLIEGMSDALPGVIEVGTEALTTFIDSVVANLPMITEIGVQAVTTVVDGISNALPMLIEAGLSIILMLVQVIIENLPTLIALGVNILTTILEAIVTALPMLIEAGIQILTTLISAITQMLPMIIEIGITILTTLISAIITALPMLIETAITLITTIIDIIIENLPTILDAGIQILIALIDGIISILPALLDAGIQIMMALLDLIIDNLPLILNAGIEILLALIDGIIKILPELIKAGLKLIMALFEAIIDNLPTIIQAGIEVLLALIEGLIDAIPDLVAAIPQIVSAIFDAFGEVDWGEIGSSIIEGVWAGIKGMGKWIGGKVSGFAGNIVGWVKDKLDINSPSRVFRDQVGKWIPAGIGVGIERNEKTALNAVDSLANSLNRDMQAEIGVTNRLRGASLNMTGVAPAGVGYSPTQNNINYDRLGQVMAKYLKFDFNIDGDRVATAVNTANAVNDQVNYMG